MAKNVSGKIQDTKTGQKCTIKVFFERGTNFGEEKYLNLKVVCEDGMLRITSLILVVKVSSASSLISLDPTIRRIRLVLLKDKHMWGWN